MNANLTFDICRKRDSKYPYFSKAPCGFEERNKELKVNFKLKILFLGYDKMNISFSLE